jgi:hypothetical protein
LTKRPSLQWHLNFTDEDLPANQQGKFSAAQRKRFRRDFMLQIVVIGMLFFLLYVAVRFVSEPKDLLTTIAGIILFPIVLVVGIGIAMVVREKWADLRDGRVLTATGVAEPYVKSVIRGIPRHAVKIGLLDLQLPEPMYRDVFYSGIHYQVFYTPNSKMIVSAVRLDNPPPKTSVPG